MALWWELHVTSYTGFILIFSYYLHHRNAYDYIQYNCKHTACDQQVSLKEREGTNISTLCFFS